MACGAKDRTRQSGKQEVPGSNPTVGKKFSFWNSRLFRMPHSTMQLQMKSTVAYTKLIPWDICIYWLTLALILFGHGQRRKAWKCWPLQSTRVFVQNLMFPLVLFVVFLALEFYHWNIFQIPEGQSPCDLDIYNETVLSLPGHHHIDVPKHAKKSSFIS